MSLDNPTKLCPKCQQYKPASAEYFPVNKQRSPGLGTYCRPCSTIYKRERARLKRKTETPEQHEIRLAKARAYAKANPEKIKAKRRRAYIAGAERYRAYTREYYTNNRVEILSDLRSRYREDSDYRLRLVEKSKDWRKRNTIKVKVNLKFYHSKRRAARLNRKDDLSKSDIVNMFEEQNGRCFYCGITLSWEVHRDIHTDHVMPFSRGGTNTLDNIVLSCEECNSDKGVKTLEEWLKVRGW